MQLQTLSLSQSHTELRKVLHPYNEVLLFFDMIIHSNFRILVSDAN